MIIDLNKYKQNKINEFESEPPVINIAFQIDSSNMDIIKAHGMYFITNVPEAHDRLQNRTEQEIFLTNLGKYFLRYAEAVRKYEDVEFKVNWYEDYLDKPYFE